MPSTRSGAAALAIAALSAASMALAQSTDPLGVGRKMLMEDNPGELWIERGKSLFHQKRGPKNASLEQCDFGMGPGRLEGAAARLPRYFADTGKVQVKRLGSQTLRQKRTEEREHMRALRATTRDDGNVFIFGSDEAPR